VSTLQLHDLTKRYGPLVAVDALTFSPTPGKVTGLVGANGSGKSTTLRMLIGLTRPTSGTATIDGLPYAELLQPIRSVGAMVDPQVFHPRRSGRNALRVLAAAADIPVARVDHLLAVVGLTGAARRKVGGYSMGMRQRLALAAALLGDPGTVILDEPANGLDPEGVHWLRGLIRSLAHEGRTVLVSSHLLAELAQTVDEVVIIANGRLIVHERIDVLARRRPGASLEEIYLELTAAAGPVPDYTIAEKS
jgi:ABC-2 type transport system ATP-binding protein